MVVDCRFTLGDPEAGERGYLAGHIPGAAFMDLGRDLAGPPGPAGRHPLPSAEAFEEAARRAGIANGSRVVAYDEAGEGGAARLWWLLRHFGHDAAAVLDGGLHAYPGALATGPEAIAPGDFTASEREGDTAHVGELSARLGESAPALIDARAPERFRGESEPVDPVAGHIPGARNVPFSSLAPEGRLRPPDELRELIGDGDFVAYCGSGVSACTVLLAAEVAELPGGRLYPGSWSEWSGQELPVERGD